MSILIKGMKMPKGNAECVEIYLYGDGTVFARQKITVNGRKINGVEAVELPPHGRLIDADELIEQINQSIAEQEKVFDSIKEDPIGKQSVWVDIMHDERIVRILRDAPTIIEAEEGEE